MPVLVDGVRYLRQPRPVFELLLQIRSGEKFDAVGRRIIKRLQQPRRDQGRNIMRLAVQDHLICSDVSRAGSCPNSVRNRCWSSFISKQSRRSRDSERCQYSAGGVVQQD